MSVLALSLIAAAVTGASPGTAVLPVQVTAVSPARAVAVASRVAQILRDEGVVIPSSPFESVEVLRLQGIAEPSDCRGQATCVAQMGAKLGARMVVAVGVSEFEDSVAVHLELVAVPSAERSLVEDHLLPSQLMDPAWGRALAPFARKLHERVAAGPIPPPRTGPPVAEPGPSLSSETPPGPGSWSGAWVIALQADSELDALGGVVTLRAGRQLLPQLTVSAGAIVTGSGIAGATVQARAVPFAGDVVVHPVVALEVPVLFRGSPVAGVRPGLGVEVVPLPWLSLSATASYLRLLGTGAEIKPGYWLGGAEVSLRL